MTCYLRRGRLAAIIAVIACHLSFTTPAMAGETSFGFYGWMTEIGGDLTFRDDDDAISADLDDLVEDSDFGYQFHFEGRGDRFGGGVDVSFVNWSETNGPVTTDLDMALIEVFGLIALGNNVDVIAGIRTLGLDVEVALPGIGSESADGATVDGFVGIRTDLPFNDYLALRMRLDAGTGEADLNYSGAASVHWNFADSAALVGGYRLVGYEFDEDGGDFDAEFDVQFSGPVFGLNLTF